METKESPLADDKPISMRPILDSKPLLYCSLLCTFIMLSFGCSTEVTQIEPRKIEVLFLGHDSEHHNSEEFLPYLSAALTKKGINFEYTSDLKDLNSQNLSYYDVLAIYANHDEIKPSQERALLEFVKQGGGLVPIHSASYCFRNSDKYVRLVGAQFSSHDTGEFTLDIVDTSHTVTRGLSPISTWDETYIHEKHTKKKVLMERVENGNREPYTWVKEYGKGRVFYTALGHDLRTWAHPDFHDLIYNGIAWAVGDLKRSAMESLNLPKLEYSPAKIANYEKRDPAPQLQAPLTPEESMKLIQVPPEFELKLFAAEPDIINPIAMNWDERGRLWILETVDYPNEINPEEGQGRDRIKIIEDTDGDGVGDQFTIFAKDLSVPTSLVFSEGGVIVSQAPHFLFLKDTDGDDIADVREVFMDGWGTFDTHAGPSNLKYGFDNRIWGVVGYSGFEGQVGTSDHEFNQAIYAFEPDGSELEVISKTSNNTWGLGFTEDFDVFISTANNTHSGFYGIPDRHMRDVKGIHLRGVEKIDGHYLFHPITRNFRQVDVFGGFTAAAGHSFYTARNYPSEYWNRVAFVSEPTGHLLHRAILKPDGPGYEEEDGWNLLASADEWVSPVAAEVGPDGAVWVLDWYNFIIQHNPTPPGFDNGPGNAHVNDLRDKQRGRIYRIVYKNEKPSTTPSIDSEDPEKLVAALSDNNLLWRMHAHRLLVEGKYTSVKKDLLDMVSDQSVDELGLNNQAFHALWILDGLGLITDEHPEVLETIEQALSHPAPGVRKAAISALPDSEETLRAIVRSVCLEDEDQRVLLAAINKLWELPSSENLSNQLIELTQRKEIQDELWLARATYMAAVRHADHFVRSLLRDQPDLLGQLERDDYQNKTNYQSFSTSIEDWGELPVPRWLNHVNIDELSGFRGVMWYRKEVYLERNELGMGARLQLGGVSNSDITYINGKEVGSGQGWDRLRNYSIPDGSLKEGKNVIAIRVEAGGGMGFGDPDDYYLFTGIRQIPLATTWKYNIEEVISSGVSEYAGGDDIISLFLNHYGPYASDLSKELEAADALVDRSYTIKTIVDQMKYDVTELVAHPGEVVEIVFENNDGMQHNLLITQPGTLRRVGSRAEEFAKEKTAAERHYVPDMPEILFFTPLLNPGETFRLRFKVPDQTGDYPYVCTFPGHWQTMNGTLSVRNVETLD